MKIFLDTTFLMPIFGLETSIENLSSQLDQVLKISSHEFLYSPVSLIEIKWQIIKLERQGKDRDLLEEIYSEAMGTLKYENNLSSVNLEDPTINDISYEIQKLGHSDYFDSAIGASAMITSDLLLTQDEKLTNRIEKLSEKQAGLFSKIQIKTWNDFFKG